NYRFIFKRSTRYTSVNYFTLRAERVCVSVSQHMTSRGACWRLRLIAGGSRCRSWSASAAWAAVGCGSTWPTKWRARCAHSCQAPQVAGAFEQAELGHLATACLDELGIDWAKFHCSLLSMPLSRK